jgi:hypothetical protein
MNYQRIYNNIVERGKNRVLEGYKEKHHVVPRCMGGTDDAENLVTLTPEEHCLCHLLLVKIQPNNIRLVRTAMFMVSSNKHQQRNNKAYGWLKRQYSEYMQGPNNPSTLNGTWNKGLSVKLRKPDLTLEEREQHSARMKSNNPCAGIKPWNHGRATDYTKSIWGSADKIYKVWLENDMPSYCRLLTLTDNGHYKDADYYTKVGPFMNMVKYFKNGWIPEQDTEWKQFKI